jgi:hypothetical protein
MAKNKLTAKEKSVLEYFKSISDSEIFIDMAITCVDEQGNIIKEAFNWDGGVYLADGLWVYPDGTIEEW